MNINPLLIMAGSWVLGVLVGSAFATEGVGLPVLGTVIGYVLLAGLAGTFYFGRVAPLFGLLIGMMQATLVRVYPLGGILLGLCVVAALMYGKKLGELALEDFYADGKTHLPGYTIAALLNLILILIFALVVWYVFPFLPNASTLAEWLPLRGIGIY